MALQGPWKLRIITRQGLMRGLPQFLERQSCLVGPFVRSHADNLSNQSWTLSMFLGTRTVRAVHFTPSFQKSCAFWTIHWITECIYKQPLVMIKKQNEGMTVSEWCTAVENRITLIYVRSAPFRSSITHSWPTKPDIYVHCGYIRLCHSQIYGLEAVLFTVWVYEYHCFGAFRVSTCVVSVRWPLQALIPICGHHWNMGYVWGKIQNWVIEP